MSGPKALIRLRVVPNARRSKVVGEYGEAIKLKIAAPAVEGKANEALLQFVASHLGVPRRAVELISGEKSRDKTVEVDGLDLDLVRARFLSR